jgi:mono/diheme cytochrome c family protein
MRACRSLWIVFAAVIGMMMTVSAQEPKKEIKHVPITATSPASGQQMYKTYCAVCHGTDGKGNGPAVEALKVPPPDLTALAGNHDGKYPAMKVAAVIRGENAMAAHGSKEMPIWGHLFRSMSGGHESEVQQRVANLNQYIESLQKK